MAEFNPPVLLMSADLLPGGGSLNGRRWAGQQLIRLWSQLCFGKDLNLLVADHALGHEVEKFLRGLKFSTSVQTYDLFDLTQVETCGALMIPDPSIGLWSLWRDAFSKPSAISLIGQIHTLSTVGAMSLLERIASDNVFSWDALICSSKAGHHVVEMVLEQRDEHLAALADIPTSRLKVNRPQLPVIPLPMPVRDIQKALPQREESRKKLGLSFDTHVILWVGRLSICSKTDLAPTYQVLERLASQLNNKVVLIELGPDGSAEEAASLMSLKKECRHLRFLRLGGNQPTSEAVKYQALAAADLAISLVDNVQETFGQSVVEAMAAGLPVVASDWDGYRDLVFNGRDGFLIPTSWATNSIPISVGLGWQHRIGATPYESFAGSLGQLVSFDLEAAFSALITLLCDSPLRRAMGRSAAETARKKFDLTVVTQQYKELVDDLAERRDSADLFWQQKQQPPLSVDPVTCFADFATTKTHNSTNLSTKTSISSLSSLNLSSARQHFWSLLDSVCPDKEKESLKQAIWRKHHFKGF